MSITPAMASFPNGVLSGAEGELILVRVSIEPRHLEDLLECLAEVPFPINPKIIHGLPTVVEFPAYESRVPEVKHTLGRSGLGVALVIARMIDQIA